MAKYLQRGTSGQGAEEVVPVTTSTGVADAAKIPQTDASGRLDQSLMPVGLVADTLTSTAAVAL